MRLQNTGRRDVNPASYTQDLVIQLAEGNLLNLEITNTKGIGLPEAGTALVADGKFATLPRFPLAKGEYIDFKALIATKADYLPQLHCETKLSDGYLIPVADKRLMMTLCIQALVIMAPFLWFGLIVPNDETGRSAARTELYLAIWSGLYVMLGVMVYVLSQKTIAYKTSLKNLEHRRLLPVWRQPFHHLAYALGQFLTQHREGSSVPRPPYRRS